MPHGMAYASQQVTTKSPSPGTAFSSSHVSQGSHSVRVKLFYNFSPQPGKWNCLNTAQHCFILCSGWIKLLASFFSGLGFWFFWWLLDLGVSSRWSSWLVWYRSGTGRRFKCSVSISWPEACSAPASCCATLVRYTAVGRELPALPQEQRRADSQGQKQTVPRTNTNQYDVL